jgi:hypothetical protein
VPLGRSRPQDATLCYLKKLIREGGRAFPRSHLRVPSTSVIVRITGNKYPASKNMQQHILGFFASILHSRSLLHFIQPSISSLSFFDLQFGLFIF